MIIVILEIDLSRENTKGWMNIFLMMREIKEWGRKIIIVMTHLMRQRKIIWCCSFFRKYYFLGLIPSLLLFFFFNSLAIQINNIKRSHLDRNGLCYDKHLISCKYFNSLCLAFLLWYNHNLNYAVSWFYDG